MKALSKKELEQRREAAKAHKKWLRESRYDEAMEKLREEWLFLLHNILYDHEYSPELMKLHIIGGGGCLIRNFAEVDSSRVKILSDICATAKGYEYMAEMVLRKRDRA